MSIYTVVIYIKFGGYAHASCSFSVTEAMWNGIHKAFVEYTRNRKSRNCRFGHAIVIPSKLRKEDTLSVSCIIPVVTGNTLTHESEGGLKKSAAKLFRNKP